MPCGIYRRPNRVTLKLLSDEERLHQQLEAAHSISSAREELAKRSWMKMDRKKNKKKHNKNKKR
jgi:type II secretory pathway component PulF